MNCNRFSFCSLCALALIWGLFGLFAGLVSTAASEKRDRTFRITASSFGSLDFLDRLTIQSLVFGSALPVLTSDTVPFGCDVTINGSLDESIERDFLVFSVTEGEIVAISLINGSPARPNFDVVGRLLRSDGSPADSCGNYVIGGGNRLTNCGPLPASGNPYRVEVVDSFLNDFGPYRAQLQRLTTPVVCDNTPLNCDVTFTGTLDSPVDTDLHTFNVIDGETVAISLINGSPAGPNFDVVGRLLKSDGAPAPSCGNYVLGGGNRLTNCGPLPASGSPYRVEVVDSFLNDSGAYFIQLQRLTAHAACQTQFLRCGVTHDGVIETPVNTDLLSFCVADSERISISLINGSPVGANFDVVGRLLKSDGSPAASCGNYVIGGSNRLVDCGPLPASGNPYRLEVVDSFLNGSGAYRVNITCSGANCLTPTKVNAASFNAAELAVESIAAAFGAWMATETRSAPSTPLPTTLAGTMLKMTDSALSPRAAPLFFVSPEQVNFQVPPGTATGRATGEITGGNGSVSIGTTQIVMVAPGLFAANANGQGVAAAVALRVKPNGDQIYESIARYDEAQKRFVPIPIDLSNASDRVYLVLFGTGFRFRSTLSATSLKLGGVDCLVSYAGRHENLVGLDQINAEIPRSLIGRGEIDVIFTADGKVANTVRVSIQ